ncbi:MAG TPA: Zn-dependent hydrolase [Solirubrobacteraceae bacterium]
MIAAEEIGARLEALAAIGGDGRGVTRLAWTPELARAEEWFRAQAGSLGLSVERDPAGNLWACPRAAPPWWGIGSHLDSVREGGRYDGALGVVAGLEVARRTSLPVAVLAFADEEGARFNTPTFGSRALSGRLDVPPLLARTDADGVTLEAALRGFGVDPAAVGDAPGWLGRLRGFLELHIDQSRAVARQEVPCGIVSRLAARTRVRVGVRGRADHAGTTSMEERSDALAAAARLVVAATELAVDGLVSTATRIVAAPNALSTIPADVSVWLDARAPDPERVDAWLEALREHAAALTDVQVELRVESRSDGVEFDAALRERLRKASGGAPELVCYAGHDAGMVAERRPAAMVLVRNRTGVSHAPEEEIDLVDAAAGVDLLARALEAVA